MSDDVKSFAVIKKEADLLKQTVFSTKKQNVEIKYERKWNSPRRGFR